MKARVKDDRGDKVKAIWDLILLIALHEELGFGNKRLKRVYDRMLDVQQDFIINSSCTDSRGKSLPYNDIETGLKMTIKRAERSGIDWKSILGIR